MRKITWVLAVVLVLAAQAVWAQPEVDARRVYLGASGVTCTLHAAAGTPSSGLGTECDVYHQTDNNTIYVKTGASTWTAVVQMPSGAAAGDLLAASSATVAARIAAVASGQVLASNGTGVAPVYTATPSLTGITGAANLTLDPAGDLVLDPTGNDVLPGTGYDINLGMLSRKYLTLHAAELWVETLVAHNTMATIGGRILVGPTTTLEADLPAADTSIVVKHNQIADGARLFMEADGKFECLAVTSGPSGSGPYTYTVTRDVDGSGANDWFAGDAVFNTRTTGHGFIDLYSVAAVIPGSTAGPAIVGQVRTGTGCSDIAPRWAIGNLNGLYGYGTDTYGAAFGDNSAAWVKIDSTNGVRIGHNATTYVDIDASGNATFSGRLTVGTGRNLLSNAEFIRGRSAGDRYTGFWGGSSATASVDPSASYTCTTSSCAQRAVHGSGWSWTALDKNTAANATIALASAANAPLGSGAVSMSLTGTPTNTLYARAWGPVVPVQPGVPYEYSVYVGMSGSWQVHARVLWYGEDGADAGDQPDYISEVNAGGACTSGTAGPSIATWCRAGGVVTPPSGARLAVLAVHNTYDGGDGNPVTYFTRPFFGQAGAAQTALTPWAPGGSTQISGDMLATDLVIANTLRSSGATSATTGTGFHIDASSGTPTFRVGDPAGNQLYWDGTNLMLGQGTVTIDSTGVEITPDIVEGWNSFNAYRFTAPTDGQYGLAGFDTGVALGQQLHTEWTGSAGLSTSVSVMSKTTGSGGVGEWLSYVISEAHSTTAALTLGAVGSSIPLQYGPLNILAIPNFQGPTSGSAGSSAGFINIQVGGVNRRIQVFNP